MMKKQQFQGKRNCEEIVVVSLFLNKHVNLARKWMISSQSIQDCEIQRSINTLNKTYEFQSGIASSILLLYDQLKQKIYCKRFKSLC